MITELESNGWPSTSLGYLFAVFLVKNLPFGDEELLVKGAVSFLFLDFHRLYARKEA